MVVDELAPSHVEIVLRIVEQRILAAEPGDHEIDPIARQVEGVGRQVHEREVTCLGPVALGVPVQSPNGELVVGQVARVVEEEPELARAGRSYISLLVRDDEPRAVRADQRLDVTGRRELERGVLIGGAW